MVLTAGKLHDFFLQQGVHPDVVEHLRGAGIFSKIIDGVKKGVNFVMRNKDTLRGVANQGRQLYNQYRQQDNKGLAGLASFALANKGALQDIANQGQSLYQNFQQGGNIFSARAGKLVAGGMPVAGKLKKKTKRQEVMGQLMRQGMTMKQASDYYKQHY